MALFSAPSIQPAYVTPSVVPPSDSNRFWRAMGVYWVCLVFTWTIGAYVQIKNLTIGLVVTEALFFALPAFLFLRNERESQSARSFRIPSMRLMAWTVLIAFCVITISVAQTIILRKNLGLPDPQFSHSHLSTLLLMALLPAFCEELVTRPVLQRTFAIYWSPRNSVLAVAALFALLHGSWLRFGETFVLGLFSGILFLKTGNYFLCVLLHATFNFFGMPFYQLATQVPWLANPATMCLAMTVVSISLWRITPSIISRPAGFIGTLNWIFFGGPSSEICLPGKRSMFAAFSATVAFLLLILSAALPFELKMTAKPLLKVDGVVSEAETETRSFEFTPANDQLVISVRADTDRGWVAFAIHGPDGRLIEQQSGGGLTIGAWKVSASEPGRYTLKITPHKARGHWNVQILQSKKLEKADQPQSGR